MQLKNKAYATLMILALVLPLAFLAVPVSAQQMSIAISPALGPVGTEVTVTGTLVSYNGKYEIYIDADDDGSFEAGELLAEGYAEGYSVNETVTIPDAYAGGRRIRLFDVYAGGDVNNPIACADGYFTVETAFSLEVSPETNYEGGAFEFTATVTGGKKEWVYQDTTPTPVLDLQVRIIKPDGTLAEIPTTIPVTEESVSITPGATVSGTLLNTPVVPNTVTLICNVKIQTADETTPTYETGSVEVTDDGTGGLSGSTTIAGFSVSITGTIYYDSGKIDLTITTDALGGTIESVTANYNYLQWGNLAELTGRPGAFEETVTVGPEDVNLVDWGTYTAYLDWDTDNEFTTDVEGSAVASATFVIRLTDKPEYGRTETVKIKAYVTEEPTTSYYYKIYDPAGNEVGSIDATEPATYPGFLSAGTWTSSVDADLGSYTVKVFKDDTVVKEQTFILNPAVLSISFTDLYYTKPEGAELIDTPNEDVERLLTVTAKFQVKYPDETVATSTEIPAGFKVYVYYNTTQVAEITLDPLVDYDVTYKKWVASWKIPKDAALGINYAFNVTAYAVIDIYGNSGPDAYASSGEQIAFFKVVPAALVVESIEQVYPGSGATIQRTMEARASLRVRYYGDNSLFTAEDLEWLNVTVTAGAETFTVSLSPEDYNWDLGLWVAKFKVPWDAPTGATNPYKFSVAQNAVVDKFGNIGPKTEELAGQEFYAQAATITVEDLKTDKAEYETGETAVISFKALYPSGDPVPADHLAAAEISLTVDSESVTATYDAATSKWIALFAVPDGWMGVKTVSLSVNSITDTAGNQGPTVACEYNFTVIRVIVIEVGVEVGSTHFPGETVDFFATSRYRGGEYDLPTEAFTATVYGPNGITAPLTAEKITTGVYKFSYTLPADAPAGGYVAKIKAYYEVAPYTYARGFGIVSFSVSPTLTEWNAWLTEIKNGVAVINTTIGEVKLSLDDLNATIISIKDGIVTLNTTLGEVKAEVEALDLSAIEAKLMSIENGIAYINTTLGEIEVKLDALDLSAVDAKLTAINGTVATISSDIGEVQTSLDEIVESIESVGGDVVQIKTKVGTIEGKVTSIDGNVATISTEIGKIRTDVSNIKDLASDASTYSKDAKSSADEAKEAAESAKSSAESLIIPIWVAVILALVAAIAAIASVVIIQRKIAG